jgi:RNA ligase (TIGR02306 family)
MRKMVTIESIEEVLPIPGADAIQKARIRGWWCVVKKDEFKSGDLCCFFEVDSFLPIVSQFEFLAKGSKPKKMIVDGAEKEGYRLKTVILRGQVSQGLALPVSVFPQVQGFEVGADITSLLDVFKYEAPIPACLSGELKGAFPAYVPKTDEEHIQNLLPWLDDYRGQHFYSTVKIDGSSMTSSRYHGEFDVCSHEWSLKESEKNTFWRMAHKYDLRNRLPDGYAIQGECAGEGISDNRHKLKGQDLFVFYVFDIDKFKFLELEDMEHFCSQIGFKTVPIHDRDIILDHTLESLLKLSDGPCPLNPTLPREGLVYCLKGSERKISFKVISNEYLIRYGL